MSENPSANGGNGTPAEDFRDDLGRFVKGNPGGPGNPYAAKVSQLRAAMLKAATPDQVTEIMEMLAGIALDKKQGAIARIAAAREFLTRTLGKPTERVVVGAAVGVTGEDFRGAIRVLLEDEEIRKVVDRRALRGITGGNGKAAG